MFIFISNLSFAGNTDSLLKVLHQVSNDTQKVILINQIAFEYIDKYPKKSLDYSHDASILAREIGYHHGLIESLINTGRVYKSRNNFKQALKHFEKANEGSTVLSDSTLVPEIRLNLAQLYYLEKMYNKANVYIDKIDEISFEKNYKLNSEFYQYKAKIKSKVGKYEEANNALDNILSISEKNSVEAANIYNQLGELNQQNADYTKAQNFYYKALKIFEYNRSYKGQAETFSLLANLNLEQNLFENSLDFNFKALAIYNETGNLTEKALVFDHIGITYQRMQNYDRAVDYLTQSLKIKTELDDPILISDSYNKMADLYEDQKDISKAIIFHFKSIKIREDLDDNEALSEAYVSLARLYYHNKQYDKAIETANKAFISAEKTGDTWLQKESAKILAESNQKQGNFKEGYFFFETYSNIKDSLYSQQQSQQIARLETIYQNEKKEKEIAVLNKEKQLQDFEIHKQSIQRNILVFSIIVMLVIFLFIYRAYHLKSKAGTLLEEQKALIEKKNKDIVSSLNYAKRIQDSILPKTSRLNDMVSDSFVLFMPKEIVSGDFYWFDRIENKSVFAVVDCTGHGVPGAFMSMIAGELLNDIIKTKRILDPGEILKKLNSRIIAGMKKTEHDSFTVDGMNIAICSIEDETNEIKFSSSGRPLVHIRNNDITEISGGKFPIGMITRKERVFETKTIKFEKDDLFYIFTDGITDQFNGTSKEKLTRDGLIEQLKQIKSNSLKVQQRLLIDFFNEWKKGTHQIDDVCMIGVRV